MRVVEFAVCSENSKIQNACIICSRNGFLIKRANFRQKYLNKADLEEMLLYWKLFKLCDLTPKSVTRCYLLWNISGNLTFLKIFADIFNKTSRLRAEVFKGDISCVSNWCDLISIPPFLQILVEVSCSCLRKSRRPPSHYRRFSSIERNHWCVTHATGDM